MFMNKIIVLIIVLLSSFSLFAQEPGQALGMRFGMQLTPTVSWFSSDEVDLVDSKYPRLGYSFGVVGDWFFKENYAFSSGLFMNSYGAKITYGDGIRLNIKNYGQREVVGDFALNPLYLEIPLGFKFLTKQFWRTRFYGQVGYNQFFLLDATMRTDEVLVEKSDMIELDKKNIKEEFAKAMYGFHFGFGTEISLGGNTYITAGVLAMFGMNDITKSTSITEMNPVNKIRALNFKLGLLF